MNTLLPFAAYVPKNFLKKSLVILGVTAGIHVLAAVTLHTFWSGIVLAIVGCVVFFLTAKRLELGVCIAFFEVIIGVHGHLFSFTIGSIPFSLRMVLFCAVMLGWFVGFLQKKWYPQIVFQRDAALFGLCILVLYACVRGIVLGQSFSVLIDDANVYMTLGYFLPLCSLAWTEATRRMVISTLFLGTVWVALFTFILTFAFTHISQEYIWELYVLVRDTRMFEVTLLSSPAWLVELFLGGDWYFRVFSQAHIFAPMVLFICFSGMFFLEKKCSMRESFWIGMVCALFLGVLFQSLSRSFFVGFLAGIVTLMGFWLFGRKESLNHWRTVLWGKGVVLAASVAALFFLWTLVSFPFPSRPDLSASPFYRGDQDNLRTLAVSSRWNMLPPLFDALQKHPVLGYGFGKELTYISDDPRIREMTGGSGILTTYRFEWGYLDIWVKLGIGGLLVYAWIFLALLFRELQNIRAHAQGIFFACQKEWLEIGLCCGVAFLFAVHMFTPYLNHPIGLFYVLVVSFLLERKGV